MVLLYAKIFCLVAYIILVNPRCARAARVTVLGLVCVCLSVCLLSHISLLERLFVLKILSCTQWAMEVQKICGVFFETTPFKSYGVKRKLKS